MIIALKESTSHVYNEFIMRSSAVVIVVGDNGNCAIVKNREGNTVRTLSLDDMLKEMKQILINKKG